MFAHLSVPPVCVGAAPKPYLKLEHHQQTAAKIRCFLPRLKDQTC